MLIEDLITDLTREEAAIPWMYLDTAGVVTCAIGHALFTVENAIALPWSHHETVEAGYAAVKAAPVGKVASYYAPLTVCRLTPEAMQAILRADIEAVLVGLRKRLPEFDEYPNPVQRALGDMAFNLGVGGLFSKFPRFIAAVRQRDWLVAAQECHRRGIGESRNLATAARFREAILC